MCTYKQRVSLMYTGVDVPAQVHFYHNNIHGALDTTDCTGEELGSMLIWFAKMVQAHNMYLLFSTLKWMTQWCKHREKYTKTQTGDPLHAHT